MYYVRILALYAYLNINLYFSIMDVHMYCKLCCPYLFDGVPAPVCLGWGRGPVHDLHHVVVLSYLSHLHNVPGCTYDNLILVNGHVLN